MVRIATTLTDLILTSAQWNIAIGGDAAETGVGPGSYDIRQSVWHVNVSPAGPRNGEALLTIMIATVLQP